MIRALLVATLLVVPFRSAHAEEKWKSGFGQGIAEAFVEKGPGNQIYVACESGAGYPATSIRFTLAGKSPPKNTDITLIFDNEKPLEVNLWDGYLPSYCHACADWFSTVIDGLKTHKFVYVRFANGMGTKFSLKGAAKAIGQCTPDFYRTY